MHYFRHVRPALDNCSFLSLQFWRKSLNILCIFVSSSWSIYIAAISTFRIFRFAASTPWASNNSVMIDAFSDNLLESRVKFWIYYTYISLILSTFKYIVRQSSSTRNFVMFFYDITGYRQCCTTHIRFTVYMKITYWTVYLCSRSSKYILKKALKRGVWALEIVAGFVSCFVSSNISLIIFTKLLKLSMRNVIRARQEENRLIKKKKQNRLAIGLRLEARTNIERGTFYFLHSVCLCPFKTAAYFSIQIVSRCFERVYSFTR